MKILLALGAIALSASNAAAICSSPDGPTASPLGDESETGTRPFVELFNIKDATKVEMFTVDAKCKRDWSSPEKSAIPCAAVKAVELDRSGIYVRPKAALAAGTHVQLTSDKKLIGDFTIKAQHKDAFVVGDAVFKRRTTPPLQGCQLAGASIDLTVKRSPTDKSNERDPFVNTFLLVYTAKPDPADPLKGLKHIVAVTLADKDGSANLRNMSYEPTWVPAKFPAKVWTVFADNDDHLGTTTELTLK